MFFVELFKSVNSKLCLQSKSNNEYGLNSSFLLMFNISDGDLRLRDGDNDNEGRIEVFYDGLWGTICDRGWNEEDAIVACRQLGLEAEKAVPGGYFPFGHGDVVLELVDCKGFESRITDCQHPGLGRSDCGHEKDAGVVCKG